MKQEQRREMRIKQRDVVRILTILLSGHSQT